MSERTPLDLLGDFAEELAAWLGPVLAEVGLVAASDDARVEELCDLLAAEARLMRGPLSRVAAGAGDQKWVRFDSTGASDSGKTQTWRVVTRDGDGNLGRVAWFGRWRRYAFFPFDATVFEHQCLRDIAAFCEQQTAAQRAARSVGAGGGR